MKATGIVRRIDDLGRVVIPKEIRRSMRIRDGEALEIFTDTINGVPCVCFAKSQTGVESELKDIEEKIHGHMVDCHEFDLAIEFHKAMAKAEAIYRQFEGRE
jgi:AbrB family looped-hinge helix DNA binding protein